VSVVVIGLNHRTAPLDLLERTTVDAQGLPKALHDLLSRPHLSEAVVLSTCNRTEIYAVAERFHGGFEDVRSFLADQARLHPADLADHLYVHYDDAAVSHLFSVAAGLDSAVLGESEILRQVHDAWESARDEGATAHTLNLLFRHSLEVGKRVRTDTAIARGITSVAHAAVAIAAERLVDLSHRRVLILGAGEMGEAMAVALAGAGVQSIAVANRTLATAEALAQRVGGRAVPLRDLRTMVQDADVLLTSTGATSMLVEEDEIKRVMVARDGRELLIVDIAVPRDVDPAVGRLPGVTLLDMDDLRAFVDQGLEARRRESVEARIIVEDELVRYRSLASAREAAPLVADLRGRAESVRQGELERLAGRLDGLDPRQREAVEVLTKGIVAKLLHEPTVRLKGSAGSARGERLAESLRDLFDL
jgi:glutamyl-tRNA reductase